LLRGQQDQNSVNDLDFEKVVSKFNSQAVFIPQGFQLVAGG
jgi:hypothetical protein